jgi:hypothetical protein
VARICLLESGAQQAICSAECAGDDDCAAAPGSVCEQGFACRVPFTVGTFADRRLCVSGSEPLSGGAAASATASSSRSS